MHELDLVDHLVQREFDDQVVQIENLTNDWNPNPSLNLS
ncbi:unnamed protein product [Schistosoma margrebowiei]|uniref:Uncharacterized protein n=1 Tax=Schistosoma margrebowiei TaxID=48269 RepID=A0A3P8AYU6_9TREM|nr:unnamed protein product [Schistosoma margrebowiei]